MAKSNSICSPDSEWQAQSDMHTLMEAAEIRKDAKRHAAAVACAKKRLEETAQVAGEPTQTAGAKK